MDWYLIVSLVTLVLVISSIVWGNNLWGRREKVKIKIIGINYVINTQPVTPEIQVAWGIEFQRSGAKDVRYINQIILRPDKKTYEELSKYFCLPERGLISIDRRLELRRDDIVSSLPTSVHPRQFTYEAHPGKSGWETAEKIASQLGKKPHVIGLKWEDSGKTTEKTFEPNDYGKWIKL